eukprot:scaffold44033_cov19-Tisochrysis_lutea.AAC.1
MGSLCGQHVQTRSSKHNMISMGRAPCTTAKVVSSVGGTLHSACVAKRKGPKGELLSAGFGFVEVNSPEVANLVIKQLQ